MAPLGYFGSPGDCRLSPWYACQRTSLDLPPLLPALPTSCPPGMSAELPNSPLSLILRRHHSCPCIHVLSAHLSSHKDTESRCLFSPGSSRPLQPLTKLETDLLDAAQSPCLPPSQPCHSIPRWFTCLSAQAACELLDGRTLSYRSPCPQYQRGLARTRHVTELN